MYSDWFEYFKRSGIDNFPLYLYNYYVFRQPILGYIRKHVSKGGSIVELGCGSALLAILLSSMGYEVLGIDNDPRIIEMSRFNNERLKGRAKLELIDMFEAPRRLGRVFDLAFSEGVIEHFRENTLKDAVKVHGKLARKVMIVVPSYYDSNVRDYDIYSIRELEKLCRSMGLIPIDKFTVGIGLIKWPKLLLPPIFLKRLLGRIFKCEAVGIVCKSSQYIQSDKKVIQNSPTKTSYKSTR